MFDIVKSINSIAPHMSKIARDVLEFSEPLEPKRDKIPAPHMPPKPDAINLREEIESAKEKHMNGQSITAYRNEITSAKKGITDVNKNMAKAY